MSADLATSPLLGPLLLTILCQRVIAPDSDAGAGSSRRQR
jgi:hypothetical protein